MYKIIEFFVITKPIQLIMRKNVKLLLFLFLSVWIGACTDLYQGDENEDVVEVIPAVGANYTPEKAYNLNVVYYVPVDADTVENWHYRLSGVTLHVQDFFRQNMKRYKVDKTFGLVVNEVPEYIKIHYIKSTRNASAMGEDHMKEMAAEIQDYFKKNAGEKSGNYYLVYMPKLNEVPFYGHYYPSPEEGMAFCECDYTKFNIRYVNSSRARARFLEGLGTLIYELGHAFFLTENSQGLEDPYMSLMGWNKFLSESSIAPLTFPNYYYESYTGRFPSGGSYVPGSPDKIRITEADARCLDQNQVFNDSYSNDPFEVVMQDIKLSSVKNPENLQKDTVFVKCKFTSTTKLAGAILYCDPWRSYANGTTVPDPTLDRDENYESGGDAYGFYVDGVEIKDLGNSSYEVEFAYPIGRLFSTSRPFVALGEKGMEAEFRFRFIAKGGMLYPNPAVSIKGPNEYRHKFKIQKVSALDLYNDAYMYWINVDGMRLAMGEITQDEFMALMPDPSDFKDQVAQTATETSWNGLK